MVSHEGYDYGVDLWALGVLLYEVYEDCSPFGNSDTEETAIFSKNQCSTYCEVEHIL